MNGGIGISPVSFFIVMIHDLKAVRRRSVDKTICYKFKKFVALYIAYTYRICINDKGVDDR